MFVTTDRWIQEPSQVLAIIASSEIIVQINVIWLRVLYHECIQKLSDGWQEKESSHRTWLWITRAMTSTTGYRIPDGFISK